MKVLVTGGCGFIGSHLVERLVGEGYETISIDHKPTYLNKKAGNIKKDISKDSIVEYFQGVETVFHLAADPFVDKSAENPKKSFEDNVIGTFNVLEACRKADVKQIVFTSTSTVYGEARVMPTPEDYPLEPISNYGASKVCGEAYISSYAGSYGIRGTNLRLANIFGPRSTHGVMYDFFHKLKKDPKKLEILGDGKQEKSYLYISDCIEAILVAWKKQKKLVDYFNVGSKERKTTNEIAKLVCKELNCSTKFEYSGGKRGWTGDVPIMLLDCSKLKKLGWTPKIEFGEGVRKYLEWIKANF